MNKPTVLQELHKICRVQSSRMCQEETDIWNDIDDCMDDACRVINRSSYLKKALYG